MTKTVNVAPGLLGRPTLAERKTRPLGRQLQLAGLTPLLAFCGFLVHGTGDRGRSPPVQRQQHIQHVLELVQAQLDTVTGLDEPGRLGSFTVKADMPSFDGVLR